MINIPKILNDLRSILSTIRRKTASPFFSGTLGDGSIHGGILGDDYIGLRLKNPDSHKVHMIYLHKDTNINGITLTDAFAKAAEEGSSFDKIINPIGTVNLKGLSSPIKNNLSLQHGLLIYSVTLG